MPYFGRSSSKKATIKHQEFVKRYAEKMGVSEEEAIKQPWAGQVPTQEKYKRIAIIFV